MEHGSTSGSGGEGNSSGENGGGSGGTGTGEGGGNGGSGGGGAISMGASAVYDVDRWSILRVTFTHFIISFSGFWVLAAIQGWLLIYNPFFWLGVMLFIWAYITIWFVNFLIYSKKVKEINNALEDIKDLKNTDENG